MNILVVNYEYPPIGGGGGFVTRDIMEYIAGQGHKVTVLTSGYNNLPLHEIRNGVEILRAPVIMRKEQSRASLPSMLSYLPSGFYQLQRRIKPKGVDIVNTHFVIPSGPLGHVIARYLDVPNVLSIHGGDIFDPTKRLSPHRIPVLSFVVNKLLMKADRVVAQSNDTRSKAITYHNARCPIHIIPLGIKKPVFKKVERMRLGLSSEDIVICSVGRLVPRKNLIEALKILASLKTQKPIKFCIIGSGPQHEEITAFIHTNGMQEQVRLCGNVSDQEKFQFLDIADLYISTAVHEGFGLVFLEAMATGTPVICYDHGGQTDFLVDGRTGYLVSCGSQSSFARRLESLIADNALRDKMGAFCKQAVKPYFIENCAGNYLKMFYTTIRQWKRKVK